MTLAAIWRGVRPGTATTAPGDARCREQAAEHAFLAQMGVALSAMLLLGIVLAGAPNLFLTPCR